MNISAPRATALALLLAAAFAGSGPAAAQSWQKFNFTDTGFAVQLPAAPAVSEGTFRTSAGLTVPSKTYTLTDDGVMYVMSVADFTGTPMDRETALAEAAKTLERRGEIKADVTERIDREFGRQISVVGKDGTRSALAIFFVNHKLYQQEGRALPPDAAAGTGKTLRFQQSLEFIGLGYEALRPENQPPGAGRRSGPGGEGGLGGQGRRGARRGPPQEALQACADKTVGARVSFKTPRGDVVEASCAQGPGGLVARPDRPPPDAGPPG